MVRHESLFVNGTFIGGPCDSSVSKEVSHSPFDRRVVGTWAEADSNFVNSALESAASAFASFRHSDTSFRQGLLVRTAEILEEEADDLANLMALEIGKPMAMAREEIRRGGVTLRLSSALLDRPERKFDLSLDGRHNAYERWGAVQVPVGPVLCITPYNWPINLALHKIGPALAAGCTVVVKGSSLSGLCNLALGRIFAAAGWPEGTVNFIQCAPGLAERAALDSRIKKVSFTGSPAVGWMLKEKLWRKRVTLELGGNAYVIVEPDADLAAAAELIAKSAFGYAGQICISAQNCLIHESVRAEFEGHLLAATQAIRSGNPLDDGVFNGPLISSDAAKNAIALVNNTSGTIKAGGELTGNVLSPTVITDPDPDSPEVQKEAFAPILTLRSYTKLSEAINEVNRSKYAIHTSVFTSESDAQTRAFNDLETAGVVFNDAPTVRFDALPYGGIKESGFGREGPEFAYDEFTEWKSYLHRNTSPPGA